MSTVAQGLDSSPFGRSAHVHRPVVLMLVYGIFLMIVGVTATAQAVMVSAQFSTNTLNSIVSTDTTLVRGFVTSFVSPDDFAAGALPGERHAIVERQLGTLVAPGTILRVEVRRPDGTVIFADDPNLRGVVAPVSAAFARASAGDTAVVDMVDVAAGDASGPALATSTVVREYFPLRLDGTVVGIVGVWRDAVPILTQLDEVRRNIVIVTLSAALVAAFVLFLVFRSAQGRITRQTQALMDSTKRDPLTGTLNHGALVDAVARSVDAARNDGTVFAVALVDIDNFRLLNETYGHAAGDRALQTIVELFGRDLPAGVILGRYGPDELLLLAPAAEIIALGILLERAHTALADHALQFDSSERLPLTVSVGFKEVLDRVEESSDWKRKRAAFAADRGVVRRGIGMAASYYGVGLGAMGKHLNPAGANMVVAGDGSVTLAVGTTEIGQGMVTVLSQIAAEALGCPVELVRVLEPDTSRVPDSGPTVASRTTVMSGNAIRDAARQIRAAMEPVIADSGLSWREAVALCVQRQVGLAAHGWAVPPATSFDIATGQGDAYICYSFSANVVELEVDTETGETRVLGVHSGHDAGRVINPTTGEGQVEGGVVQGLGYALVEEHALQDGRILNDQFSTYIIPTPLDTPEIRALLVEHPYPWGPFGAKGLGETPIIAVAPAVTAAIQHATGARLSEIPATPERVWTALRRMDSPEAALSARA